MTKQTIFCALSFALAFAARADDAAHMRYLQAVNGEIQLLPALAHDEIPRGHAEGLKAPGGFTFDIEWRENKLTRLKVYSEKGGVCRIRSHGGMGSPLLRKARGKCPNPAIAAAIEPPPGAPQSVFLRAKPLDSVCFDFDTEPGEKLEFRGVSGNQAWTDYAAHLTDRFLKTAEAARIAENVLDWQLDTGGWPKNVPMHDVLSPRERAAVLAMKGDKKRGTIDNAATFAEMRFLARMYKATGKKEYLEGVVRGIGFLLYLQYPNGGWPQFDPAKEGYWHQITFNDGAMVNVMNILRDVYEERPPFDIPIPAETKTAARKAFRNGLKCIFRTQIRQDGRLAVWCQQHDRETLEPCAGRAFELPALCSMESLGILELLMSLDLDEYPPAVGALVKDSLAGAAEWYDRSAMKGWKVERNWRRPDGVLSSRLVHTPEDESAELWCRYYTLDTNRPFTGTRQGTMNFDFSEMERGENMNYMWFNTCGATFRAEYARWQEKEKRRVERAAKRKAAKTTRWRGGRGNGGMAYIEGEKDTWENPGNWSAGVPDEEDTVVFADNAELWSMERDGYRCGKIVLENNARVALRSNYEANGAVNPAFVPSAIEGAGTIVLSRAGIETKDGETLSIPAAVSIVADPKEGRGSWLSAKGRGRMKVAGAVSCPGNKLCITGQVSLDGKLDGFERMDAASEVAIAHPPPVKPVVVSVGADAEFTSIQQAIDSIPPNSPAPHVVRVAPGRYREKINVPANLGAILLVAEAKDPAKTVISWHDTPATPGPGGRGLGTQGSATMKVASADFTMEGFTIENTATPERLAATGGREQAGQCVALAVTGDRAHFKRCRILGWQDTLFAGGSVGETPARQYFEDCYIEGSVDFIFGGSIAVFNRCHLHSVDGGYVTAGSHAESMAFGYVFMKCRVTCVPGKKTVLGRPWRPYANITFVACDFGDAVTSEGWSDWTCENGKRVWRAAEYACTQKGPVRRDAIVETGGAKELRERLHACSCTTIFDILKSTDNWNFQSSTR